MSATSHDAHAELAEPVDTALHQIALYDRADALGRARENQIAGLQFEEARQIRDRLRHRPDQLRYVRALLLFAIDGEPDRALADMPNLRDGVNRSERRRMIETLRRVPRTAELL